MLHTYIYIQKLNNNLYIFIIWLVSNHTYVVRNIQFGTFSAKQLHHRYMVIAYSIN